MGGGRKTLGSIVLREAEFIVAIIGPKSRDLLAEYIFLVTVIA